MIFWGKSYQLKKSKLIIRGIGYLLRFFQIYPPINLHNQYRGRLSPVDTQGDQEQVFVPYSSGNPKALIFDHDGHNQEVECSHQELAVDPQSGLPSSGPLA